MCALPPSPAASRSARPQPKVENVRLRLGDRAATTALVARFERSNFDLRVVAFEPCATVLSWCEENKTEHAIVGGFYLRPGGPPLGHLQIGGTARWTEPFDSPWDGRRACVHSETGRVALASWQELAPDVGGDVLQAGPMLVTAGRPMIHPGEDPEGFSAEAHQFDSDITKGRYPRAALGLTESELIAVATEGRADAEAGLTMAELARAMAEFGAREAINLDGGGSASLVVGGALVNTPREEHGVELVGGREVATALQFVPR